MPFSPHPPDGIREKVQLELIEIREWLQKKKKGFFSIIRQQGPLAAVEAMKQ